MIIMTIRIITHACICTMHACIPARAHTPVCSHALTCMSICVYEAGRHERLHVRMCACTRMHAWFYVWYAWMNAWLLPFNACICLFPCMHACVHRYVCKVQAAHLQNFIRFQSAYLSTLIRIFTVRIRYRGPFVIWAVSHETVTIAYAEYEGSEQSTHPQLMLWPYNSVVELSS